MRIALEEYRWWIIGHLPQKVHLSFDIDGLIPSFVQIPHTSSGRFEVEQIFYLLKGIGALRKTNHRIDLNEIELETMIGMQTSGQRFCSDS